MSEDELEHLTAGYEHWDQKRLVTFILAHGCARLNMLRASEEQRRLPNSATLEQQKFLLQLARDLREPEPPAKGNVSSSPVEQHEVPQYLEKAKRAFDELGVQDRWLVRDATEKLLRTVDQLAEDLGPERAIGAGVAQEHNPERKQQAGSNAQESS
jgi:hypothetical protein